MSVYCPEIQHVPGINIPHVDAISRSFGPTARDPREILADEVEMVLPRATTSEDTDGLVTQAAMMINEEMKREVASWIDIFKSHQRDDPDCILTQKIAMEKLTSDGERMYRVRDGILYVNDNGYKPMVPASLRKRLLASAHGSLLAGHRGEYVTFERLRSEFFWPKMRADVKAYVSACESCGVHKTAPAQLILTPPATRTDVNAPAFLRVEVDTKGPMDLSLIHI